MNVKSMPRSRDVTLNTEALFRTKDKGGPPTGERLFCKSSRFHEALCWLLMAKSRSFQKEAV